MRASCSLEAVPGSVRYLCSRVSSRSCATRTSRRMPASLSEALSSTSPLSETVREMASTNPCGAGRRRASSARRGKSLACFSRLRRRLRVAINVLCTSSSSFGSSTPPRAARSTCSRMSCAPPMVRSCVESNLRASPVSARRSKASSKSGVGDRSRASSAEAEKSQKSANRARILGYSRMWRVLVSMQGYLTTDAQRTQCERKKTAH